MAFTITVGPVTSINAGNPGSTVSLTLTGCTAGRAILGGLYWNHASSTISSVTGTGESNATLVGTAPYNGGSANGEGKCQLFYFPSLAASGDKTIEVTLTDSFGGVGMWAFEVSEPIAPDTNAGWHAEATASSATPSINVTTDSPNCLIIGTVTGGTGTDPSVGSGFTLIPITQYGLRNAGEYKLNSGAAGTTAVGFTLGSSDQYVIAAAAFKSAAGGGAVARPNLLLLGCG